MEYISRSQWYHSQLKNFLGNSDQNQLSIDLYTSEVKRLKRQYPVTVKVGPVLSTEDLRHSCIIKRKGA